MNFSRFISLLTVVLLPFAVSAQDDNIKRFRFTTHANGAIPHAMNNKAFKRSFTGIYDITASFNVRLFSGFSAGIAGRFAEFKTPDNKIPGLNTYGQIYGGGLRLAYYHYISENNVLFAGITGGRANIHYFGLSCQNPSEPLQTLYSSTYLEPEAGIMFYVEGNFAIGVQLSYSAYDYVFDPYAICLNQHKAYLDTDLVGGTQNLNLGFGLTYSFLRK